MQGSGHDAHNRFGLTDADLDAIYPQIRMAMPNVDREHLEETIGRLIAERKASIAVAGDQIRVEFGNFFYFVVDRPRP